MEETPNWHVLLLGGSSGTGKTVLAHQLARRFGVGLTQVDDVRLALQRVTTPAEQPDLHFFVATPAVWQRSPAELRDRLIAVGRIVSQALEPIVAHHLDTPYPLILEGDGILPGVFAESPIRQHGGARLRALFLLEPTEADIIANMTARGRGFDQHAAAEQVTQAQMNWLYGQWIENEARRCGLPAISARPRDTLLDRAVAALA